MNNKFKKMNGKIKNKNFSAYGQINNLEDAMKIATEFHKQKNQKFKETFLNNKLNEDDSKSKKHPTFELSDEELKRRIEFAKKKNEIAKETLNESSSISDILNTIADEMIEH